MKETTIQTLRNAFGNTILRTECTKNCSKCHTPTAFHLIYSLKTSVVGVSTPNLRKQTPALGDPGRTYRWVPDWTQVFVFNASLSFAIVYCPAPHNVLCLHVSMLVTGTMIFKEHKNDRRIIVIIISIFLAFTSVKECSSSLTCIINSSKLTNL